MSAAHEPTLAERESEVWERTARLSGWSAAAALHSKKVHEPALGEGQWPFCEECSRIAYDRDAAVDSVVWPCPTAMALGIHR